MTWAVLSILALMVNLNLFLTFRLFVGLRRIRLHQPQQQDNPIGYVFSAFEGRKVMNNETEASTQFASSKVFIYLSPQCKKCKNKLPVIRELFDDISNIAISVKLLSAESAFRMKRFLGHESLKSNALLIDNAQLLMMNPTQMSPAYQFYDENNRLVAQGLIGDSEWLSFTAQIKEQGQTDDRQ